MMFLKSTIVAVLALAAGADAATTKPKASQVVTNETMSLGDGTNVNTTSKTTEFLGTEYNPLKCQLQFSSVQCNPTKNDCGNLNGYPLTCEKLGRQNGKEKFQCRCANAQQCQNSTAKGFDGVPQFGDCSSGQKCADAYGHVSSTLDLRICAEKIHCVKEINTTASEPAQICHTCRSCIAQNDAAGAKLSDKRRFDCTKICPKEILDSITKRNKEGVGIADELSSGSGSSASSTSSSSGSSGSAGVTSKPPTKSKSSGTTVSMTVAATVVAASLTVALL